MKIDENSRLYENFQQVAKELAGAQEGHVDDLEKTEGDEVVLKGANVTYQEDERQQIDTKARVNTLHCPEITATENLDLAEKISERLHAANNNLKNSLGDVKKYTGTAHAMLKAAGVNITATTKVFFNIFSLMQLMLETAQQQRTAGREMRNAELLATTASIERQADKQIEAASQRRSAALVSAGFSIGMGGVSVGTAAFGAASGAAAALTEGAASEVSDMADEVLEAAKDVSDVSKDVNNLTKNVNDLTKNVNDLTKGVGKLTENVDKLSQQGGAGTQSIDKIINNTNKTISQGQNELTGNLGKAGESVNPLKTQPEINVKVKEQPKLDAGGDVKQPEITVKVKDDPKLDAGSAGGGNKSKSVHPDKLADDLSNDAEFSKAKETVENWRNGLRGKPSDEVVKAAHTLKKASSILTRQAKTGFARQAALKGAIEGLTAISKGTGDILAASMNMQAEMTMAEATREQVNQKFAEAAMQDAVEAMQTAQEVINTVIRAMLQILTSQVEMMKGMHFA